MHESQKVRETDTEVEKIKCNLCIETSPPQQKQKQKQKQDLHNK